MGQSEGPEVWKSADLVATFLEGIRGALPLAAEQIQVMLQLVAATRVEAPRFLDLGCGDGILGAAVLRRFPDSRGVFLDFSEPMLQAAARALAGQAERVTLVPADYGDPGWVDAVASHLPFDAVVSGFSIHHQPDTRKRELYAEIRDLLGPGGILIQVEHVSSETPWLASAWEEYFLEGLYRHLSAHRPGTTREQALEIYRQRQDRDSNLLAPVEAQCDWLRELGYTDVSCALKVFEMAVFCGRRPLP